MMAWNPRGKPLRSDQREESGHHPRTTPALVKKEPTSPPLPEEKRMPPPADHCTEERQHKNSLQHRRGRAPALGRQLEAPRVASEAESTQRSPFGGWLPTVGVQC